jgi:prepilin-type N-terminal cleavage/methylation domain-containing protein
MLRLKRSRKGEKGFTLIELLVVAAIIGILLALAIPNLFKARISANEANAKKMMQTLWSAEGEYFEEDLDDNGVKDYINLVGNLTTSPSLRCPRGGACTESDSLVDTTFEGNVTSGGTADCIKPKAGYCIKFDSTVTDLQSGFGWQASMASADRTGRRDFAVYGDKSIRCSLSTQISGSAGIFEANFNSSGCD